MLAPRQPTRAQLLTGLPDLQAGARPAVLRELAEFGAQVGLAVTPARQRGLAVIEGCATIAGDAASAALASIEPARSQRRFHTCAPAQLWKRTSRAAKSGLNSGRRAQDRLRSRSCTSAPTAARGLAQLPERLARALGRGRRVADQHRRRHAASTRDPRSDDSIELGGMLLFAPPKTSRLPPLAAISKSTPNLPRVTSNGSVVDIGEASPSNASDDPPPRAACSAAPASGDGGGVRRPGHALHPRGGGRAVRLRAAVGGDLCGGRLHHSAGGERARRPRDAARARRGRSATCGRSGCGRRSSSSLPRRSRWATPPCRRATSLAPASGCGCSWVRGECAPVLAARGRGGARLARGEWRPSPARRSPGSRCRATRRSRSRWRRIVVGPDLRRGRPPATRRR